MQDTLLDKALCKIITVWRQCAPLKKLFQRFLEISNSHWRQINLVIFKMPLENFQQSKIFKVINDRTYDSAQVDKSQTHANSAKKTCKNFIVIYSLRAHYKASGGADVQELWRKCTHPPEVSTCLIELTCVKDKASLLEPGQSWSSRQASLLEPVTVQ